MRKNNWKKAVSVVLGLIIALMDFIISYGVDFLVGISF